MVASNNKKFVRNLIFVVLFIIIILIVILIIMIRQYYTNEDVVRLDYINSNKYKDEIIILPRNMNYFYKQYNGEVSRLTLEKSMYSFAHKIVPTYREIFAQQYRNELDSYFEQNKFAIGVDTGIDDYKEFKLLVDGILSLNDYLTVETYELSPSTPSKTSHYIITKMFIKYKGNERIIFKVKVSNEKLKNISSVKYIFDSLEN